MGFCIVVDNFLKPGLWVKAQLRLCDINLLGAYVVKSGHYDVGAIIIKLNRMDGTAQVLSQVRGATGERGWIRGTGVNPVPEHQANAYIDHELGHDPDLWVVEIEDPKGDYEVDGPII